MTNFPREENLADLVGDRTYNDYIQWRVFKDLDGELPGVNVLMVLGNSWTMVSGADFKATIDRILRQLDA